MIINFRDDIIFSEDDYADQIFFLFKGKVIMYHDITSDINMESFVPMEKAFNIASVIYDKGSYFGDNEVLGAVKTRTHTCVCYEDCILYTLHYNHLIDNLQGFGKLNDLMRKIATEKKNYYDVLNLEMKLKYNNNAKVEVLFNKCKKQIWTDYMSTKRATMKKKAKT